QDLLQCPDGPQRLGTLGAAGALLPVTQAGDTDLQPVARRVVLPPRQGQAAGAYRAAQGDGEGAAGRGRAQVRGAAASGRGGGRPPPGTPGGGPGPHAVARQVVLHPLQGQAAGGYRGAQGDVEGAAAQGRVQVRGDDVSVRCGVRHAGAFL